MTSSLLHFTSSEINGAEIAYNNKIINQYIKQIVKNINAFSKVIIYDMFRVIKV